MWHADVIQEVAKAASTGPRHPAYTLIVSGSERSGKTSVLKALRVLASASGWATLDTSVAGPSDAYWLENMVSASENYLAKNDALTTPRFMVSDDSILDYDFVFKNPDCLRRSLTDLSDLMTERGKGVLLTVDDFHLSALEPAVLFANTIQHVTRREERPVLMVASCLSDALTTQNGLFANDQMTFFHRCWRKELAPINGQSS